MTRDAEVSRKRPTTSSVPDGQEANRGGALAGLTVLDLTTGLAGPVATRLLAEVGADVIKVEPPDGDVVRRVCPAGFAAWNRSKISISLDLNTDADRCTLDDLLSRSDVIVHDLTPCKAERLGLDDRSLSYRFPGLIVAAVTGYPPHHPDAERAGYEILVQARLGAMDEQQAIGPGPMFIRMPFANWCAAYLLAAGITVRLLQRRASGASYPVYTSLLQGALVPAGLYWQRAERPPDWMTRHALRRDDHPSNLTIFRCADDRWIHLLGGFTESEPITTALAAAGRSHLAGSAVTVETRHEWSSVIASKTVDEWTALLWPAGVICMPVLDMGEVLTLEQTRVNEYAVPVEDQRFGPTVQAGFPFEIRPAPSVRGPAPWTPTQPLTALRNSVINGCQTEQTPAANGVDSARVGLSGIRVVDFGSYVAGPLGAQCFADFGADVIKVEPPWGEQGRTINQFTGCQRGKRALAVNLRDPASAEIIERLIRSADVVMHNMRESAAKRLRIDEESVRAINPAAVYAHSSAYGARGPWREFAAFDPAACALSGWEQHISGTGNPPTWLRNSAMDSQAGLSLFLASVIALYRRAVTGQASPVRTSLLGVAAMSSSEALVRADGSRTPFQPIDANQHGVSPYYRIYEASDAWIAIAAVSERDRQALHKALGVDSASALEPVIAECPAADILARLRSDDVPAELVVIDGRDGFFDREIRLKTGLVTGFATKDYGWFEHPAGFWSDAHGSIGSTRGIPAVGEQTVEILGELGYSQPEIQSLVDRHVVSVAPTQPPENVTAKRLTRSLATTIE